MMPDSRFIAFLSIFLVFCCLPIACATDPGTWPGFKEEFITPEGRVIDRNQQEISHSEGQGYSMLLAVSFGDLETFCLLWQWTKSHLQIRKTDSLSAWSWGELANGVTAPIDFNNASDGDICIAWALLLARERWNLPELEDEGRKIIASIQRYLLLETFGKTVLLPGYYGFTQTNAVIVNPSYLVSPAFKVFARYGDRVLWQRVHGESLSLLSENSFGRWQLPADWLLLKQDKIAVLAAKPPLFGYEAIRVFLWAFWDGSLEQLSGAENLLNLVESSGKLPVTINLNEDSFNEQEAPAGFIAIAANCAQQLKRTEQAKKLWLQAEKKVQQEDKKLLFTGPVSIGQFSENSMNFPTGCFFFLAGICCSCLIPGTGQAAQSIVSVSSGIGQSPATVIFQKKQQSTLESTARTMVKGTVLQSPAEISRSSQRFLQELPQPSAKGVENVTADPFAAVLGYAWQEYRLGNYTQAKVFFLQAVASNIAENRRNAEYGLLYSYLKLGDTDAALPLLQEFVARGEQLESTAPPLAEIFFERGDFEAVQGLFPKLSPLQQKEWQERIVLAQFQHDMLTLSEGSKHDEMRNFLQQYKSMLEECQQNEQFFRMAVLLVAESPDLARKIFTDLSRCLADDQHWNERVLREQLRLMSNNDLLVAASAPSEGKIADLSRNRLLQEALWEKLDQLEQKNSEYDSFVQAVYKQDPNNREAASMAAWACYQRGEYDCAGDIFSTLVQNNATDDALLGLIYALQKQGALIEALALLDQHSDRESAIFNQLRHDLHATLGGTLYRDKRYQEALAHLEQALMYQPEDVELTKMLLWSRYHLGETKPLVAFLWQQYQENSSADTAESLSDLLGTLNNPVFTREVMDRFAESDTAEVRKIAGDYAFQQKHPVLADQIYQGKSPYAGSAAPAFDTMFHFRSKGGDDGTSSLSATTLIMRQKVSSQFGKTWSIALCPLAMSSGSLPEDIPVGSVFRSPDQSQVQPGLWEEDVLAWGWRGALQIEGSLDWDIEIGTTPVNGIVAPTLVGKIEGSGSDWMLAVGRDPVRDSMLSWLGQTDPYSGRE